MKDKEQRQQTQVLHHLKQDAERMNAVDMELLEKLVTIGRMYGGNDKAFSSLAAAGLATGADGWYFPTEKGIEIIKPRVKLYRQLKWLGSLFLAALIALIAESILERLIS